MFNINKTEEKTKIAVRKISKNKLAKNNTFAIFPPIFFIVFPPMLVKILRCCGGM